MLEILSLDNDAGGTLFNQNSVRILENDFS